MWNGVVVLNVLLLQNNYTLQACASDSAGVAPDINKIYPVQCADNICLTNKGFRVWIQMNFSGALFDPLEKVNMDSLQNMESIKALWSLWLFLKIVRFFHIWQPTP